MSATESALVIRLAREIAASPERIWEVVGTETGLREWLGVCVFEPRVGGRMLIDALTGDALAGGSRWIMFGKVQSYDPPRELSFTWCELDPATHAVWPADTLLTIRLTPMRRGEHPARPGAGQVPAPTGEVALTLIELLHSGFEALPDAKSQYANYLEGWSSLDDLSKLAELCE